MQHQHTIRAKRVKTLLFLGIAIFVLCLFRRTVLKVGTLIMGAAVITFLVKPLAGAFEKKLPRPPAALAALFTVLGAVILLIWLIAPVMVRQFRDLAHLLPKSLSMVSGAVDRISGWISARFGMFRLPGNIWGGSGSSLPELAAGVIGFAGKFADFAGRISLMVVLSFFFLCDRENLLLRLELLIPAKHRAVAVRMGNAVLREMRMYLRGQFTVAFSVAFLATAGLIILQVSGAVALGPVIGLLNMIPYFGPFIGGIPAVLAALADSWQKAGLTLAMIVIVQQLDNNFISPRVMGNLTGMSPALVLIAIFAGSQVAGIAGMLFALPFIMAFRTLFRVFVQRHENI